MARRDSAEEKREYNRKRYWRDKEKILAQQKERYEENKDVQQEKARDYYWANKDKIKARAAAYYQTHAEERKKEESKRRYDKKLMAVNILGGKCFRCDTTHPAALDFHHKDPEEKMFSIGDMLMHSKRIPLDVLEIEIKKCELLCKNCHAIKHCTWEIV